MKTPVGGFSFSTKGSHWTLVEAILEVSFPLETFCHVFECILPAILKKLWFTVEEIFVFTFPLLQQQSNAIKVDLCL